MLLVLKKGEKQTNILLSTITAKSRKLWSILYLCRFPPKNSTSSPGLRNLQFGERGPLSCKQGSPERFDSSWERVDLTLVSLLSQTSFLCWRFHIVFRI